MKDLEKTLIVGAKIEIGKRYAKGRGVAAGDVVELVQGEFEHWNGLYTETQLAPSVWCEDRKEFDSIYHLFGNDLEEFMDCKVLKK